MTDARKQFVISIMSHDRVGIVHEASRAINTLGGDIADLRQSVLRGYFTMILLASFPQAMTIERVKEALSALDLPGIPPLQASVIEAKDVVGAATEADLSNAYVLTASGQRRTGFVATVSSFCARNCINILDLSTAASDDSYTMILLVDLSNSPDDIGEIHHKLAAFAHESGLNIVLQHYDIFRATNEVSLL